MHTEDKNITRSEARKNPGEWSDAELERALSKLSRREKEAVMVLIDGLLAADFANKLWDHLLFTGW